MTKLLIVFVWAEMERTVLAKRTVVVRVVVEKEVSLRIDTRVVTRVEYSVSSTVTVTCIGFAEVVIQLLAGKVFVRVILVVWQVVGAVLLSLGVAGHVDLDFVAEFVEGKLGTPPKEKTSGGEQHDASGCRIGKCLSISAPTSLSMLNSCLSNCSSAKVNFKKIIQHNPHIHDAWKGLIGMAKELS